MSDPWLQQRIFEANRQKLAEIEQKVADGMNLNPQWIEEARAQVARDVAHQAAINAAKQARQAADAAELQRQREFKQAHAQQEMETYKQRARLVWDGDDASFAAAFPGLWQQEQIRRTNERMARQPAPAVKL